VFVSGGKGTITAGLDGVFSARAMAAMPSFVQIAIAGLAATGALMVWLELVVRSAGVDVAVFFMPLAMVAYIWPATAGIAKRAVEILVALILSKFVIIASLSLGLTTITESGTGSILAGCGILLLAAFSPFVLFRMTPVVEAAAIAHMEGMSRRPLRAAASAATFADQPAVQMVMGAASRGDGGPAGVGTADSLVPSVRPAAPSYVPPAAADD
jgi:hypothetical protein